MTLFIKNWEKHFESNETRKLKKLLWVKIPNGQDSLAYRIISKRKDGPQVFTAWILMVQIASKQTPRGELPFSPDELGIITGFPADIFEKAINVLKEPKIDWIRQSPDEPAESPDALADHRENLPIEEGRKEGRKEGKNIVEYLNRHTGQNYKATTKKTQALINARIKEGFSEADFKTVIEKKAAEWKGTEFSKYLRPETLFGTKFESYLNQKKQLSIEEKGDLYFGKE